MNYEKGLFELNASANYLRKETVAEKFISSFADIKFKLDHGNLLNFRIRPSKTFIQYDFGVYEFKQATSYFVNPYAFILSDLVSKKTVKSVGVVTKMNENVKIHVS